jgi:hypothetical protein
MSEPIPPATPGFSAYGVPQATTPYYSDRPVAFRGPESLGGLLLILAGVAAGVALLLDWLERDDTSGWGLLREALEDIPGAFSSGLWQPMVILLGGGALFVLGILMWLPARTHRFLGVVALLVSLAVTAGVLVPLVNAKWQLGGFGPGFWCAIAVAVLGLLGSLKAILTRSSGSHRHQVP